MNSAIGQNDLGTLLVATFQDVDGTVIDVSDATTRQILVRKPSGEVETLTASFTTDGTDGKIQATGAATTFDEFGLYEIQARIAGTGFAHSSRSVGFGVHRVLA